MSCCNNCGCNTTPCKNISISEIAPLDYVQGVDANGCPKFQSVTTLIPVVHPAATLTNNAAPFSWNGTTQTGNIPQAGSLVANANGSYTYTPGDGSAPVIIPKDCCPVMSKSGDVVTFTNGDGSTITFTIHPAAAFAQTAAPFSWNGTTQTGNIPQAPRLVANADGSYTFTPGDGSTPVVIPKECCPTMAMAGNVVTFTNGDGSVISFTIHPAATLTNNAAAFAWNQTTQSGNVPQSPSLTLTPTGFLFTPGNGMAATVYTEPADTFISGFSIVGNVATITRNDGTTFTQTVPTSIDINVQSFQLSGSNLVLTETDGTVHNVALPAEVKVNAVSYVPGTGVITITNSDGTSVSTTISVCASLNALPTGATGVAGTTLFLGKDCEWHALPPMVVDGTTITGVGTAANPFSAGDLDANADGSYTWENADGTTFDIPNVNVPFRITGTVGAAGQKAQPKTFDGVAVTDSVQHIGDVFLGGVAGDVIPADVTAANPTKLYVEGTTHLNAIGGTTRDQIVRFTGNGAPSAEFQAEMVIANGVASLEHKPHAPARYNGYAVDEKANFTTNSTVFQHAPVGDSHVMWLSDSGIIATPQSYTSAPSAPRLYTDVAVWAKMVLGFSELFVMDGAGNVTQISSHPSFARELLPAPAQLPTGHYTYSYNVFSGIGMLMLNGGNLSKWMIFNIDSGEYVEYDANGKEQGKGASEHFKVGKEHPLPADFDGVRGAVYLEYSKKKNEISEKQIRLNEEKALS